MGTVVWGRPAEQDVLDIERAWAFRNPLPGPLDLVTDLSRVEALDRLPFLRVLHYAARRQNDLQKRVRRHVLVRPGGFEGTIVAGFSHVQSVKHDWRVVHTSQDAFMALPEAAPQIGDYVESLTLTAMAHAVSIHQVRSLLQRDPGLSVEGVADELAVSVRSLQRRLLAANSSFRELIGEVRLDLAQQLLEGTDDKLATIAKRVGLGSDAQLIRLFQERLGESPGSYRRRVRG